MYKEHEQFDDWIEAYNKALESNDIGFKVFENIGELGILLLNQGNYANALAICEKSIIKYVDVIVCDVLCDSYNLIEGYIESMLGMKRCTNILHACKEAEKIIGNNPDLWDNLSRKYDKLREKYAELFTEQTIQAYFRTAKEYQRVYDVAKNSDIVSENFFIALDQVVKICSEQKDYLRVIQAYEQLLMMEIKTDEIVVGRRRNLEGICTYRLKLGNTYVKLSKFEEAKKQFEQILEEVKPIITYENTYIITLYKLCKHFPEGI